MPRKGMGQQPTPKSELSRLLFLQTGQRYDYALTQFDFDTATFAEALLLLMAEGATVVCRPGSGGRSFGVAVWQNDVRYAPKWLYDDEEVNDWSNLIIGQLRKEEAAD